MTRIVYRTDGGLLNTVLLPLNTNCNTKTTCETVQTARSSHLPEDARIINADDFVDCINSTFKKQSDENNIIRMRNLYVSGINLLCDANIISINDTSVNNSSRIVLDIDHDGINNCTYNIICSFGDECNIFCKAIESSTNMCLVCNGIRYLDYKIITFHHLIFQRIYSSIVGMSFIKMYLVPK